MNSISKEAKIGKNVVFKDNCIVEENVTINDNCYIDSNTIIRSGTTIGENSFIGANCIIGEYMMDFCLDKTKHDHELTIGSNALIRSGSIIYTGSKIGNDFQTGHRVTIREKAEIGNHVSAGTLTDIQGNCKIGSYVRMHSNVHIGQLSQIDNFVWIYPYVVLTNDPTPPSNNFVGVHIHSFAIVATGSIIMPGLDLGQDCLIGAGAIVTKSVAPYAIAVGNPARVISDVRKTKNKITGEPAYPWRDHFSNYMPWKDCGFDKWYESLTLDQKKMYGIENIEE
jgi:acetyltransferase-like isoleucine patch superfamily enzyme